MQAASFQGYSGHRSWVLEEGGTCVVDNIEFVYQGGVEYVSSTRRHLVPNGAGTTDYVCRNTLARKDGTGEKFARVKYFVRV